MANADKTKGTTTVGHGTIVGAVVTAVLMMSPSAWAAGFSAVDRLHLQLGVGVAAGAVSVDTADETIEFAGPGLLDGVQVGGRPTHRLSIFLELDNLTLKSPAERDGGQSDQRSKLSFGFLSGIGAGYRFSPAEVYVSGAVGVAVNNVIASAEEIILDECRVGLGLSVMAGKTWPVSGLWELGLCAQFLLMTTGTAAPSMLDHITIAGGATLIASWDIPL